MLICPWLCPLGYIVDCIDRTINKHTTSTTTTKTHSFQKHKWSQNLKGGTGLACFNCCRKGCTIFNVLSHPDDANLSTQFRRNHFRAWNLIVCRVDVKAVSYVGRLWRNWHRIHKFDVFRINMQLYIDYSCFLCTMQLSTGSGGYKVYDKSPKLLRVVSSREKLRFVKLWCFGG